MPHDKFYGIAATELAEQRPDRDLFARAYALALGDPEKSKAIYIGIRAERLEEEAMLAARREAEAEKERVKLERERSKLRAKTQNVRPQRAEEMRPPDQSSEAASTKPGSMEFSDPEVAKAVQRMREALALSGGRKG